MTIGFVLDDTLDSTDGVQQYILQLGKRFIKAGHSVHYLVGNTKRTDIKQVHSLGRNVRVRFNKNRMSMPLSASSSAIRTVLQSNNFDVLHVQMPYSPFLASKVIKQAHKLGIPVVATFHILPASNLQNFALRILSKVQFRSKARLSQVIAVSQPAKKCVDNTFGTDSVVIPNPVNITQYKSNPKSKRNEEKRRIVFVGRLVERKGCLQLLKAVKWLHDHEYLTETEVIICGDGPLRAQLEHFVTLHRLKEVVSFKGKVSETQKVSLLQSATIAAFPSYEGESFGIVLIEAMAAGSEVVLAGDNPGYRSVMNNREQQLVNPHNTDVFAAQLLHFLQNKSERKKANEWQDTHVKQYDVKVVAKKVLQEYKAVIAKNTKDYHNRYNGG